MELYYKESSEMIFLKKLLHQFNIRFLTELYFRFYSPSFSHIHIAIA